MPTTLTIFMYTLYSNVGPSPLHPSFRPEIGAATALHMGVMNKSSVVNDALMSIEEENDNNTYGDNVNVDAMVWGTAIRADDISKQFDEFLHTFDLNGIESTLPYYIDLMQANIIEGTISINVDATHIHQFDQTNSSNGTRNNLYNSLIAYPQDVIPMFDAVAERVRRTKFDEFEDDYTRAQFMQVRIYNLHNKRAMRELNPEDIDTLVCIKGMIIRCGSIIPDMKLAVFQCSACNNYVQAGIEDGAIAQPSQCMQCNTKHTYQLIHNRCQYIDKQHIRLQETPDDIPEGDTPHTVTIHAFQSLVDIAKPGDRVEITAVYRATAARINPRKRTLRTVYKTYLDAIHIRKAEKHASSQSSISDDTPDAIQKRTIEQIKQLSTDPNIYDRLVKSIAPSIWELEDVKRGILCLLFGGANSEQGAASARFRGELNVLMCGDPGTSKSQLLQYVNKIAPRGIYTSGKGSSAVGLTASIVKDVETREHVLESGALVLSDKGVCCIDEFDKMSDTTRAILHEVMEQQTVSIAKAGIVCTLNARTSILASANPKESRYNPKLSVVQNIQLPPTLLSRFDLIYLVLDQPNELRDRRLAKHLVSLYYDDSDRPQIGSSSIHDIIPQSLLTSYIAYARSHIRPLLSADAQDLLIHSYVEMRGVGRNAGGKVVTATPRQLESLIRISEALAKLHFSSVVTVQYVEEAVRLMKVATQQAATDPTTGRIDMDLLTTGRTTNERERNESILKRIRDLFADKRTYKIHHLLKDYNNISTHEQQIDNENDLRNLLLLLENEQFVKMGTGNMSDSVKRVV